MKQSFKIRRIIAMSVLFLSFLFVILTSSNSRAVFEPRQVQGETVLAIDALEKLEVSDKYPDTSYNRNEFGSGWIDTNGCDTRNIILNRDLTKVVIDSGCKVASGVLADPYTGKTINFMRSTGSADVQIDHVVALSNAWQTGAYKLSKQVRIELANDPLELLAVSGDANQAKSGSDASAWLPPLKEFRCQYVARQIAVKIKYSLWVSTLEEKAMRKVLSGCKSELLPTP